MEWFIVTLDMYRRVATQAGALALRNWPVLASVFAYSAIISLTVSLAGLLGMAGGLVVSLVSAACVGSFLYLVEMMLRTTRTTWEDFRRSFFVYVGDVVGVGFVLWVFAQLAGPALAPLPQGRVLHLCLDILVIVFFNAVPELIYLGHHTVLALLAESYRFITENWIEWFPPNIVVMGVLLALWRLPVGSLPGLAVQRAAVALFLYFAMVMRGLLFLELSGSTRRARAFRHRAGR